jgi:hypothetical protein
MTSLRCPACNHRVAQKSSDGKLRIRTKIVSFRKDGKAEIVCQRCGKDLLIDLAIGPELKRALETPSPRLVLKPARPNKILDEKLTNP